MTLSSIPGPALFTATVNPIALPALTLDESGVLLTLNWPAVLGGNATTTSLNCLVCPPMPQSTGSVAVKNVVISTSHRQEYLCDTPLIVIGCVQSVPTAEVGVGA